jgi:hypothetical protein
MVEAKKKAEGLSSRLARVPSLGAELSKASSELNAGLAAVQQVLISSRLGVEAEVPLDGVGEEYVMYYLTFAKARPGGWGLYTVAESGNEERAELVPLRSASKQLLMAAAEKLPDLLDRLLATAVGELAVVASRKNTVAEVLTSLGLDASAAMAKPSPPAPFEGDDEIPF